MNASSEGALHSTVDDLKALLRDAEQVLSGAGDEAGEKVQEIRERMRAALDETHSAYDRIRDSAREQLSQYDDYVRAHPYQAIGIAAAIGALAGILVSRRH